MVGTEARIPAHSQVLSILSIDCGTKSLVVCANQCTKIFDVA